MNRCELCGRTEPVTESEVLLSPQLIYEVMVYGMPVIFGNDCHMLPLLSMLPKRPRQSDEA